MGLAEGLITPCYVSLYGSILSSFSPSSRSSCFLNLFSLLPRSRRSTVLRSLRAFPAMPVSSRRSLLASLLSFLVSFL